MFFSEEEEEGKKKDLTTRNGDLSKDQHQNYGVNMVREFHQ